jgi:putative heme-binding domain-containing protein
VRLALAAVAQQLPATHRWEIITGLVSHPEDAGDHNLPLMYWYAAEPLADANPERALALGMMAGPSVPRVRDYMLRRIGSGDAKTSLALLVGCLSKAEDASLQLTFLRGIRAALVGQRQAAAPEGWGPVYAKLKAASEPQVAEETVALAVTFGDEDARAQLRQLAQQGESPAAARREAIECLLSAGDRELAPVLHKLLGAAAMRDLALRGLAQYDSPETPRIVLETYKQLTPDEKRLAIATLCSRPAYGLELLRAIQAKRVAATDLSADMVRQLQNLRSDEVDALLKDVWGTARETVEDKAKLIAHYEQLLKASPSDAADASLGRAVFAKTCQRCHVLYGEGGRVGPDLTGSNRANLEYLLTNILDPSAVMAKEYQPSVIVTADGRVVTGIVRSETGKSLTVQTAEETLVIPKDEIEERKLSPQSMMPEDQLRQFSEHQVRSLVAYLSGREQAPLLATSENASLIFNGKDLTGWRGDAKLWTVDSGEIVGHTSGLGHNAFLVSEMAAQDFQLSLEVKLVDNAGNSGIQFRSASLQNGEMKGYQADIGAGWWGKLYEESGRALLWDKSGEKHVKNGEWNTYRIEAVGPRVRTWINGQLCVDLDDPEGARRGVFGLQLHSGGKTEVRFRKLELHVIEEQAAERD